MVATSSRGFAVAELASTKEAIFIQSKEAKVWWSTRLREQKQGLSILMNAIVHATGACAGTGQQWAANEAGSLGISCDTTLVTLVNGRMSGLMINSGKHARYSSRACFHAGSLFLFEFRVYFRGRFISGRVANRLSTVLSAACVVF